MIAEESFWTLNNMMNVIKKLIICDNVLVQSTGRVTKFTFSLFVMDLDLVRCHRKCLANISPTGLGTNL